MEKTTCPSCGASYNGKRCRHCGYAHFGETYHARQERSQNSHKKAAGSYPLLRFALLLVLVYSLMPLLRNWGLKLEAMENRPAAVITPQPEPILQPENMVIFYQEEGITIFTTPEQFADPNNFALFIHNESDMSMTVSSGDVQVNGIGLPHASLVCKARPGEIGKGWLEVDLGEWEAAGIQEIHTLTFSLTGLGQDGRIHFQTDEISLIAEGADDTWENS